MTTAKSEAGGFRFPILQGVLPIKGGQIPAEIIAGRLRAEGIPARTWQEGAGEALGLFVGILGTGHVVVPKEYAQEARDILAADEAAWAEEEAAEDDSDA